MKKKAVVKIGTKLISSSIQNGSLNEEFIYSVLESIQKMQKMGHQILIVSSGATFLGNINFDLVVDDEIVAKQMAAACGQPILMQKWKKIANELNLNVAQFLLTQEEICYRDRFLYLRDTLQNLLNKNIIPILNENDAIAIQANTFGENDLLATKTAVSLFPSDLLIFLCEQQGLYTANPQEDPNAELITKVENQNILQKCEFGTTGVSKGGMKAKVKAAYLASMCGVKTFITYGRQNAIIEKIIQGEEHGTIFVPKERLSGYKAWLIMQEAHGNIIVNSGAKKALQQKDGSSLLPIGVVGYQGDFERGDVVKIKDGKNVIAMGVTNYSSYDIISIAGKHSSEIEKTLGYYNGAEIIHRDKMVCLEEDEK